MTMLDRMRRHKGWLKWSLGLVVLTFVAFYATDFVRDANTVVAGAASPSDVVASVEGQTLTAGDFQRRYLAQVQAYQTAYGDQIDEQMLRRLGIDSQILQQMVDEQATLFEAQRQGIQVSDDELAQQIFTIPGLQENGKFIGEQRYQQLLSSQRPPMTKAAFETNLRNTMMIDRLRSALTDWMALSDPEVEREYRRRNEKVKLQVVALTADAFLSKVTVSDEDVAGYFDQHKADYLLGEQRKVKFLLIDRDAARTKVTVPDAEVQRYYSQNLQQYSTPEQVRASHILFTTTGKTEADVSTQAQAVLARAKAGEDFAALARQYSDDPGSKVKGGDLDYFGRGRMVPEFEKAAFESAPGLVPDLVKSQFGFHIIKVVDKKATSASPLDAVRPQIQDTLAWQRVDQDIAAQAETFADRIKSPADLDTVARENGIAIIESGFFQRGDPIAGLGAAPEVSAAAFTLEDGKASALLNTPRGPAFMAVTGKKAPSMPVLDEVKARVRTDLTRVRAVELSRQRASEIAATLKGAANFSAAAKAQGLEAKDTQLIPRESPLPDVGVSPEVDKVAFTVPVGSVSGPITTSQGTVIVKVTEREDVTPDKFRTARELFRSELLTERRNRFFGAYMTRAKQKMAITINEDVVKKVVGT